MIVSQIKTKSTIANILVGIVTFLLLFSTSNLLLSEVAAQSTTLPAFPGAEGFGSRTIGGRGGRIIEVTNLNDSGAGSFRQAVSVESGPRIVVFRVGGKLESRSDIAISNPYLTVAGQTAPGQGFVITGSRLGVQTHDVIIRGLKARPGDGPGANVNTRDGIAISAFANSETYNVIIDHNSISWALDENISIWDNTHGEQGIKLHDVTYSWNIITEALRCAVYTEPNESFNCSRSGNAPFDRVVHGFGAIIGESSEYVSLHHNLLANNDFRNPAITQGVKMEFVNNVVYNYGLGPLSITYGGNSIGPNAPVFINVIGNYFKPTAGSLNTRIDANTTGTIKGIEIRCITPPNSKVYVNGNIDTLYRPNNSSDQWDAVLFQYDCRNDLIARVKSNSSVLSRSSGLNPTTATVAYDQVLTSAGALAQGRDPVDTRAVTTTRNGTSPVSQQIINAPGGRNNWHLDTPLEAGPMPVYNTVQSSVTDTDHDGMPDSWESARGGNLSPSATAPSGYTLVEEYINSLITGSPTTTPLPTPVISPSPSTGPILGDLNNSGTVDMTDYNIMIQDFGRTGSAGFIPADINRNGKVDIFDYNTLIQNLEFDQQPK